MDELARHSGRVRKTPIRTVRGLVTRRQQIIATHRATTTGPISRSPRALERAGAIRCDRHNSVIADLGMVMQPAQ